MPSCIQTIGIPFQKASGLFLFFFFFSCTKVSTKVGTPNCCCWRKPKALGAGRIHSCLGKYYTCSELNPFACFSKGIWLQKHKRLRAMWPYFLEDFSWSVPRGQGLGVKTYFYHTWISMYAIYMPFFSSHTEMFAPIWVVWNVKGNTGNKCVRHTIPSVYTGIIDRYKT
jgi:hypothetical protein